MFCESGGCGRTYFRLLVGDASGANECSILSDTVPGWVYETVVKVTIFLISIEVEGIV